MLYQLQSAAGPSRVAMARTAGRSNVRMEEVSACTNWAPPFQLADGKSKYGVPIFLENGNINPEYLKRERAEAKAVKAKNIVDERKKRTNLIKNKEYELADYVRKNIGFGGLGAKGGGEEEKKPAAGSRRRR